MCAEYINSGIVARMLGVHPCTLGMLAMKGDLPQPVKVGEMRLFVRTDIERWLKQRQRKDGKV